MALDNRYINMKCDKCGSTNFVFTVLQHHIHKNNKTYYMSEISARCECGTKKTISDLTTYIV